MALSREIVLFITFLPDQFRADRLEFLCHSISVVVPPRLSPAMLPRFTRVRFNLLPSYPEIREIKFFVFHFVG
jgi:hypothetical protein